MGRRVRPADAGRIRCPRALAPILALLVSAVPAAADPILCTGETPSGSTVAVRIDAPLPGDVVEDSLPCDGLAVVEGAATALSDFPPFDLYFVLDASGSTGAASGVDVDGDDLVGAGGPADNTDPGDSVLAAEVLAVRRFLAAVEELDVRVALIDFSAVLDDPAPGEQGRIRLVQPLTDDLDLVRVGLDDVESSGSRGATDYAGALDVALAEHERAGEPERSALAFFVTDGKPTFPRFPWNSTEAQDVAAALAAARRLAAADLRLDTYEIGDFDDRGLLSEMAASTGGRSVASLSAAELLEELPRTRLSGVDSVTVVNETSGVRVEADLAPDGTFRAEVPLVPDLNALSVLVVPSEGESFELECDTSVSHACFAELDLCFRETTSAILEDLFADSAELFEAFSELSPCETLALEEGASPCGDALREYAALAVNVEDGRLTSTCEIDLSDLGPDMPESAQEALELVRSLLEAGDEASCAEAAAIASAINSGGAVLEAEPPVPEPVECVITDPETGLDMTIEITSPVTGGERPLTEPCDGEVVVEGSAEVENLSNLFDLFFVIDSSGSTSAASGRDVDGDGIVGVGGPFANTDPGDSVLEAELEAVRLFVGDLDPAWARVAIIEFAAILEGTDGRMRIVQSLTDDFSLVESALVDISVLGSDGATDYGGAIRLLNEEFVANAVPDERIPICFFLSDGVPTFPEPPYNSTEPPDRESAISATMESADLGIEVNTFEVGPAGAADILTEMADLTGGEFFPALVAGDIIDVLNEFNLVGIESVTIVNETTGEVVEGTVESDGSFTGAVTLENGENEIVVTVESDGETVVVGSCTTSVDLIYENLLCNPLNATTWATLCRVTAQPEAFIHRVRHLPGTGDVEVGFLPGLGATGHRAYRGDLDVLGLAYTHRSPFTDGAAECSLPALGGEVLDPGAADDGRNWYYVVATTGPDGAVGFGTADVDGDGLPDFARPGPDVDPADAVVDLCP